MQKAKFVGLHLEQPATQYFETETVKRIRFSWMCLEMIDLSHGKSQRHFRRAEVVHASRRHAGVHDQEMINVLSEYIVYYTSEPSVDTKLWMIKTTKRRSTTILEVMPHTTYYVRVQARNAAGYGPLSAVVVYSPPTGLFVCYVCVHCVCLHFVCVCVCVCVCVKERERERERESMCVWVCVCMCV